MVTSSTFLELMNNVNRIKHINKIDRSFSFYHREALLTSTKYFADQIVIRLVDI